MKPIGCLALLAFLALPALAGAPDAVTSDGGRYFGPLVDGKLHGRGRIEWSNGARYEGDFAHGLMHGRGRRQYGNGTVYEGNFRDGLASGQGEVRYKNGRAYRGEFARGDFHGKGRFEYPGGDVYEGDFEKGEFTGNGRHTRKDGSSYEGGFREWKYHGRGRYADPSGTTYEGDFVNGTLEGRGKVTSRVSTYEGELKRWQYHGRGVLRYANGEVQEGSFEHGFFQGDAKALNEGKKMLADAEAALYAQQSLLDKSLASLKPGQPGRPDMYLLAVAGDGSQEVFRREVDFVQRAFAERFGTGERSVVLVNSRNTLATRPMATLTSIDAALEAIGRRMNLEEDILFLFLTSHGSQDHELVLNQTAMPLRGLPARELGRLLKKSAIRWKVVVVSACYSGGFIDALKDERTLVITAARRDRRSFGCADENDFTYFGRAFFKESLPGAQSFQHAFKKASALVGEWERKEAGEDSRSLPQIHAPAPIEAHLKRWWGGLTPR
jgi:hypothetical protein